MSRTGQAGLARSADSWEPLLISYFCALQDDSGCYGATLQEFRASREGIAVCPHCLTIIHTSSCSREKAVAMDKKKKDSLGAVGLACMHLYAYPVAPLLYPKVMQEKCVRGSEGDLQRIWELCCINGSRRSC